MKLFCRQSGTGQPLLILHGLYGSGDNWHSVGKVLSQYFEVFLIDLRNHGNSPHHPEMNYEVMIDDLKEFIIDRSLDQIYLVAHSMGGKVAMGYTLQNPDKVAKLVIVDIAMRSYETQETFNKEAAAHKIIIESLGKIDISGSRSRADIDQQLAGYLSHKPLRDFILKNLKRNAEGKFYWALNVAALKDNLSKIMQGIDANNNIFNRPVLLIKGKKSVYVNNEDYQQLRNTFSKIKMEELETGHWVHAEQPENVTALIKEFLC
jgi:esterase